MPDPNPYEPPKTEQPLKRSQIVKRSVGLAAILLLTPPAMAIAVAASCSAIDLVPYGVWQLLNFGLPFVVLAALMYWATRFDNRPDAHGEKWRHKTLLTTPYVAGATAVGIVMMAAMTIAFWNSLDDPILNQRLTVVGWSLFFGPPSITLIVKLWLAWRSSR